MPKRIVIVGAAGRDFHNFNVVFRDRDEYEVVAFTAAQLPNIDNRRYPCQLAGDRYPDGIPIQPEHGLEALIKERNVDAAVLSYSDLSYEQVMVIASRVLSAGADFWLLSPHHTMLPSRLPVVAICAARTGAGKSQTSRRVAQILASIGRRPIIVRHPMPYGDLAAQAVQRFATDADLIKHDVTIEEREEYEPIIRAGWVVYAGVDYGRILSAAEAEADVIVWDGGNNDTPFFVADLLIAVMDAHRPDHALRYYPGDANVRLADVILINKIDTASLAEIEKARETARSMNPDAKIIEAASPIAADQPDLIRGKRVLVVEDGPTTTHGGMSFGAGWVAARRFGAAEIIDPRPYAVGSIAKTYDDYPGIGPILPAMGYGQAQVGDLFETINRTPCDLVVIGTPIDLRRLGALEKPAVRVTYELQVVGQPTLEEVLADVEGTCARVVGDPE
jgi:predicted GTPase